jgi:pyridoxal phosphate enzyme (YggS family)
VIAEIGPRLEAVRKRVADAARASGRDPEAVRIVAVSKTKGSDAIRTAYAAGHRDFGENYAQELVKKAAELEDLPHLRWHFIGHLQRNKARLVARVASVVHTVDSVRLAEELGKRATEAPVPSARAFSRRGDALDARLQVLVEVNIAGESQKSGCPPDDVPALLDAIEHEPGLRLTGLMTVPPAFEDPEASRPFFEQLSKLRDAHGGAARLPELSMGMSHDLEQAVRAGATVVRVGTAIFGERA